MKQVMLPAGNVHQITRSDLQQATGDSLEALVVQCEHEGEASVRSHAGVLTLKRVSTDGRPTRYAALWQLFVKLSDRKLKPVATIAVATRSRHAGLPWRALLAAAGTDPLKRTRPDAVPPTPWLSAVLHEDAPSELSASWLDATARSIALAWIIHVAEEEGVEVAA